MKLAQGHKRSWRLKIFLTILAILAGSYLGNMPVKFESHWPKGSGDVSFFCKLLTTDDAQRTTHEA